MTAHALHGAVISLKRVKKGSEELNWFVTSLDENRVILKRFRGDFFQFAFDRVSDADRENANSFFAKIFSDSGNDRAI